MNISPRKHGDSGDVDILSWDEIPVGMPTIETWGSPTSLSTTGDGI
jgi:hypothetical protein